MKGYELDKLADLVHPDIDEIDKKYQESENKLQAILKRAKQVDD